MNLVVLGATGGTGRLVVEQALAAGHTVTALARSPEKLTLRNPNLHVVAGQATDRSAVSRALSSGHSCRPKAASDAERHCGSPHFAFRMAADRLTTCAPFPCGWLSHPPW